MKGTMKIISALIIALMVISIAAPVFATQIDGVTIRPDTSTIQQSGAESTLNKVLGAIKYLGIFLAVGITMFMGIKYMMGSVEEKAEYKKTMIPLVVGVVLLFAAAIIIQVIQSVTTSTIGG